MSTNCRLERPTAVIIPAGRDAAMQVTCTGHGGLPGAPKAARNPWARQPPRLRGCESSAPGLGQPVTE